MNPSPLFKQPSTFIPQQAPRVAQRGIYYDLFFIIGNIALIGMVLAWAGLFGYRWYLNQEITKLQEKLTTSANEALSGKSAQDVENIKKVDNRLILTKPLIEKHLIIQPLLALVDEVTLTNSVRFTNFKYENTNEGTFEVTTNGLAKSFSSLAYQQDVFKEHASIAGATFSNFSLDEKTGNVSFSLAFSVIPDPLLFKNTVTEIAPAPAPETEGEEETLLDEEETT